jgi:hypothetical protein
MLQRLIYIYVDGIISWRLISEAASTIAFLDITPHPEAVELKPPPGGGTSQLSPV